MIFISYSWLDKAFAETVVDGLQRARTPYWIDSERLDLEKNLAGQIVRGLKQSSSILLIESFSSAASPWVQFEMGIAKALDRSVARLRPAEHRQPGSAFCRWRLP